MISSSFITDPLSILFVGIVIVVGGIIGLKLHPFLALLLGALVVAIMTPAATIEHAALAKGATPAAAHLLSSRSIGERIALEFGNTWANWVSLSPWQLSLGSVCWKAELQKGSYALC